MECSDTPSRPWCFRRWVLVLVVYNCLYYIWSWCVFALRLEALAVGATCGYVDYWCTSVAISSPLSQLVLSSFSSIAYHSTLFQLSLLSLVSLSPLTTGLSPVWWLCHQSVSFWRQAATLSWYSCCSLPWLSTSSVT